MDNATKLAITESFSAKVAWKRAEALKLCERIREYLSDTYGVLIPEHSRSVVETDWVLSGGQVKKETRTEKIDKQHWFEEVGGDEKAIELINTYYGIRSANMAVGRLFVDKATSLVSLQTAAVWYSRNRVDPLWNWRKSQIIRKRYRDYLEVNEDWKACHPLHVVLTLPHEGGFFNGKRFYARELIELFRDLRRQKFWKDMVWGGEYGLEVKKGKEGNGLHIHIHSFCMLKPGIRRNDFYERLEAAWGKLAGLKDTHAQVWAETLYRIKRDEAGKKMYNETLVYQTVNEYFGFAEDDLEDWEYDQFADAIPPQFVKTGKPIKEYVDENSPIEHYVQGVMECIKYHFKPGFDVQENGEYDLDLMGEVLTETRGLRMYSRYGALYNEKTLNFNQLEQEPEIDTENEEEADKEIDVMATLNNEQEVINPFTKEIAEEDEYETVIFCPGSINYSPDKKVHWKENTRVQVLAPGKTIKEYFKELVLFSYSSNISSEKWKDFKLLDTWARPRSSVKSGTTQWPALA